MVTSGPHPEDGAASVSLENVMGNMGTVENGVLRIGNLWPSVAGYYQCVLSNGSLEVANTTALLYCEWVGGGGGGEGERRGERRGGERVREGEGRGVERARGGVREGEGRG